MAFGLGNFCKNSLGFGGIQSMQRWKKRHIWLILYEREGKGVNIPRNWLEV
jgi:hypothetical protein